MRDSFHDRLEALENGSYDVRFDHKHYLLTKLTLLGGRLIKLYAYELGGNDVISLNYWAPLKTLGIVRVFRGALLSG